MICDDDNDNDGGGGDNDDAWCRQCSSKEKLPSA
jgi:hypothetical protein